MIAVVCCFIIAAVCADPCPAQFIVAHRGASHDAPENTLAAFRLAWKQGADAIEGDFYLTSDGRIVCIHDKTTKRVAPRQPELSVSKATLQQLRQLDVGRWKADKFAGERIPTLSEVLATVPEGKRIFVEIKCGPEIVPALKKQLAGSKLDARQIVLIGFSQDVVRACRQQMPRYKCNWLTGYRRKKGEEIWKPTARDVVASLRRTGATGLGSHANGNVIDAKFVKSVRDAGCELHMWTVNDVDAAKRLFGLGVDSITTDRPALIRKALPASAPVQQLRRELSPRASE